MYRVRSKKKAGATIAKSKEEIIRENQAKVTRFISTNTNNLYFSDSYQKVFKNMGESDIPLRMLIITFSILTICSDSFERKGNKLKLQTHADRNRSATDIWRHIKSVRKASIFDVMKALHSICSNDDTTLETFFCDTIKRRVFVFQRNAESYRDEYDEPSFFDMKPYKDEFDLTFREWGTIA